MLTWREVETVIPEGVVVASSKSQEWMLPWWWENYIKHNSYPVTFVDLGLSEAGKDFCRGKGELVKIPSFPFLGTSEEIKEGRAEFWESTFGGNLWSGKRSYWHQKSIALLQTPYQNTIWLDTDCEVLCSLDPLFEKIARDEAILICPIYEKTQAYSKEKGIIFEDEILFNSGVIGCKRGSSYIMQWAAHTIEDHGFHCGDDNLLSRLIYEKDWPVQILDPLYNWQELAQGRRSDVKISHWAGESGKFFISLKKLNLL